jgi:hypothetical protein
MQRLLKAGANPNARLSTGATALFGAAESGRVDGVELLLPHRADVNFRDVQGLSALAIAVAVRLVPDHIDRGQPTSQGSFCVSRAAKALLFAPC